MATTTAQAVIFKDFVEHGTPPVTNFPVAEVTISHDLKDGEVLVQLVYLSVDPYMRGRMRDVKGSYVPPFTPGQPLAGYALGQVKESKAPAFPAGSFVFGATLKWQTLQVTTTETLRRVDEQFLSDTGLPLSVYLGALGMTGMTAYCSLVRIGKPKSGETVFVSGAAGAVGLIVGQLCKHVFGCTVIGSAGSDDKVSQLSSYGYDAVFNYKKEKTSEALKRLAPKGIDVYFDNVGGETLEAALDACNTFARIVGCGSISGYDTPADQRYGVKNLFNIVAKQITFQGFIVRSFADMRDEFESSVKQYLREGKVKHVEHVVAGGLTEAGRAFVDMMGGGNFGKALVSVSPDPYRKAQNEI